MSEEASQKQPAELQVEMALSRTILASDRTLLAWIRTSLSLFGFGFTLAKFIHGYIASGAMRGINPDTTRNIGVAMIVLGFCGLLGGIWEHYKTVKQLEMPSRISIASPALFMASALSLIGLYLVYDLMSESTK
jgi:putative membrane protein